MFNPLNLHIISMMFLISTYTEGYRKLQWQSFFVRDFLLQFDNIRVDTILCWRAEELLALQKLIPDKQMAKKITLDNSKIHRDHQVLYIMDLSCDDSTQILEDAERLHQFQSPYKWLIIDSNSSKNNRNLFNYMTLLCDNEVILATNIGNNTIKMEQLYKYSHRDSTIVYEKYGRWTFDNGLEDQRTELVTSYRRRNLQGTVIHASFVTHYPDTIHHLTDFRFPSRDSITKHTHVLNSILFEYTNATYKVRAVSGWGHLEPNGSWTGLISRLIKHEDDVAGTGLLLTSERQPYVHYIRPSSPTKVVFIYRKPPLSYVSNIFALSFQWAVWISIFALFIVATGLLYFIVLWEIHQSKHQEDTSQYIPRFEASWSELILFNISVLCQQGAEIEPRGLSGRIITIFLFTSFMFLYVSYSANIVALLQSSSDIDSLEDLLNSRLDVGVMDIEYNHVWFEGAVEPVRKAIYEKKVGPPGFLPLLEGVRRIRQGLFAFHVEAGPCYHEIAKTFQENEKCDLQELAGYAQSVTTYYVIYKGSPYTEMFKIGWDKLQEYGFQQRTFNRFYKPKPKCGNQGANFVTVGIIDSYASFVIWGLGAAIAVIFLFIELLAVRYR